MPEAGACAVRDRLVPHAKSGGDLSQGRQKNRRVEITVKK
jgi:flagellar motor protein MotB